MTQNEWNALTVRRYGQPGGDNILAPYAYELLMYGPDEESGDVQSTLWAGLLRGPLFREGDKTEFGYSEVLTDDEKAFLANASGAIVTENSQGFVSVAWYGPEEAEKLASDWAVTVEDAEPAEEVES